MFNLKEKIKVFNGIARAKLFGHPLLCTLVITERCDARCKMCNVWSYGSAAKEMSIEDIKKICAILKRIHVSNVLITGGEPFLRDDIGKIINLFSQNGFLTHLTTNGGPQVTYDRLKEVIKGGLSNLYVSIDSLDPDKHDSVRGVKGLWRHAIDVLKFAIRNMPNRVYVCTVVSKMNSTELPQLVRVMNNLGTSVNINPIMFYSGPERGDRLFSRNSKELELSESDMDVINNIYGELIKMKRRGAGIYNSTRFLKGSLYYLKTGDISWECSAGEDYFLIFPDGAVSLCYEMSPFANILNSDFEVDFYNPGFKESLQLIRNKCRGCIRNSCREATYLIRYNYEIIEKVIDNVKSIIFAHRRSDSYL